jgi:hypothetical protein
LTVVPAGCGLARLLVNDVIESVDGLLEPLDEAEPLASTTTYGTDQSAWLASAVTPAFLPQTATA